MSVRARLRRGLRGCLWWSGRGATAVEFALILPAFLALVFGIEEFGRVMFTQATMQFAVEEGARYWLASPAASPATVVAVAQSKLAGVDGVTVTAPADGSLLATATFTFLVPSLIPVGPIALTAQATVPLN